MGGMCKVCSGLGVYGGCPQCGVEPLGEDLARYARAQASPETSHTIDPVTYDLQQRVAALEEEMATLKREFADSNAVSGRWLPGISSTPTAEASSYE